MLSDKAKTTIRQAYKRMGENLSNFTPRKQQTFLIAEIAKTLSGEYSKDRKIITIEAGTGTGKSLAYCLGAIPIAMSRQLKVCISTATVALQEQLVNKDLPFLQKHSGLDFKYVLVKGRQRYVCKQKLALAVNDDDTQTGFSFAEKPKQSDIKLLKKLHKALKDGTWQGDSDSWPEPIPHYLWQQIQSDKHSCLKHLAEHTHCPFHKAREIMDQADVLVINHSLLLADLSLGGGKILPEPSDCYYVIDEAHHLPQITRDHASATITLKGAIDWLDKLKDCGDKITKLLKSQRTISPALKLADDSQDLIVEMRKIITFIDNNKSVYFPANKQGGYDSRHDEKLYRFENGVLPKSLKNWSEDCFELSKKTLSHINKLYNALLESLKEHEVKVFLAEPLLAEAGFLIQRLENLNSLWQMYAKTDSEKAAPLARWIELSEGKKQDYLVCASPIEVGFTLEDNLWSQCEGAVLCSATLRALNSFDHFRFQAGLSAHDGSQYQQVDSPFNYPENAELFIANTQFEPNELAFTDELIEKIPAIIGDNLGCLVLFSSYWQMQKVAEAILAKQPKFNLLVQGEHSRQHIISEHKKRVDNKKQSIIFGTQSFSEGLDLVGEYLTNLVITKLPFSVPTSPVEQAQSEHITNKGGNPFMTLSVPEASKKLIQACGRLLRNEQDHGKITILDRRIVSKRYGKQLIDSLPPFKLTIE
jgi:ATP-dependent DNA helicase DinG